jgi:hypothetical protein
MAALGTLTDEQFQRLAEILWKNDQLHGGVLPAKAPQPLYWAKKPTMAPPAGPETVEEPF